MRYPFVVVLKRKSDRVVDMISVLLCFFSASAFILFQLREGYVKIIFSLFTFVILIGTFGNLFSGRRVRYGYWLLLSAVGWLAMPYGQWLSVFFVLLAFLEYQAKYPLEIGFSPDRIVINSLFKKKFGWSAFSNIMLKDGLLTMDFKNNRLIQREVDEEEDGDAEEEEFNDYCREMLRTTEGMAKKS
jgi:hypothetical protein